jgi:hypothetical protein
MSAELSKQELLLLEYLAQSGPLLEPQVATAFCGQHTDDEEYGDAAYSLVQNLRRLLDRGLVWRQELALTMPIDVWSIDDDAKEAIRTGRVSGEGSDELTAEELVLLSALNEHGPVTGPDLTAKMWPNADDATFLKRAAELDSALIELLGAGLVSHEWQVSRFPLSRWGVSCPDAGHKPGTEAPEKLAVGEKGLEAK